MKNEKFLKSRKPSRQRVCGEFWNLRGQHNWEGKKNPTEYTSNHNCQRSSPEAHVCHQRAKAGQRGAGYMLSIRTRPECPEDNLRELM